MDSHVDEDEGNAEPTEPATGDAGDSPEPKPRVKKVKKKKVKAAPEPPKPKKKVKAAPEPPPEEPKHRRKIIIMLLVAIVLAFFVPRLIAFRGVPLAVNFEFADQLFHLYHVDLLTKRHTLDDAYMDQAYFHQFPDMKDPRLPTRWPPGIYWITFPFAKAFGVYSIWTTQIPNFLGTVLTLIGVVLLGRIMGGTRLGLWAALLVVLTPALVAASWYYSLDYPLIGMILLGLYLLWRSKGFTVWWATLIFGLWSGLSMCIKLSYPIYLIGPSLAALTMGLWALGQDARRMARGKKRQGAWPILVLAPAATAITVACVHFLLNPEWKEIWNEFVVHAQLRALPAATIDPWTMEWFLCLFKFAVNNYPWPLLLLAVPGIFLLHYWRRAMPGRWLILTYFWGTWFCLTGMINKLERYMTPVYPLVCLLTVWAVYQMAPKNWRNKVLTVVALCYASMLVYLHFDPTPWHQGQDGRKASFHVYYEFLMPGKKRMDALRKKIYHTDYHLKPHVDKILEWAAKDKKRQPMGMVYLKDPKGMVLDFPVGEVVVPAVHHLRDRMIVSFLFGMPGIPPSLLNVPLLIVAHPAGVDVEKRHKELKVIKKWTVWLRAGKGSGHYTFSVCKSRLPPLPPMPPGGHGIPGKPPPGHRIEGPQGPSGPIPKHYIKKPPPPPPGGAPHPGQPPQ